MNRFIKNLFPSLITDYRSLITIIFLTSYFLFLNSCNSTEPPPPPPVIEPTDTVTVSITDKTHRSITLNVKTTLNNKDWKIELFREKQAEEDTLLADFSVATEDTTIIDDNGGKGLELETEYSYYTILSTEEGEVKDTSEKVIGRTLGATSHNYVWEEYTIGESGALYDVWGTDENNVYAVGAFDIGDTNYGLAHWDGTKWTPLDEPGGYAIFGFAENDIWIAGGRVHHFDGASWNRKDPSGSVLHDNVTYTSIWGTSSENMYFGNQGGKIVHWDGSRGSVANVEASESFRDIYGLDANNIYAVAGTSDAYRPGELFYYNGANWKLLKTGSLMPNEDQLYGPFYSVWTYSNELYVGGGSLAQRIDGIWIEERFGYIIYRVRGTNSNNIFASGPFGNVAHYNGIEWHKYEELTRDSGVMSGIFISGSKVFIVGYTTSNTTLIYIANK